MDKMPVSLQDANDFVAMHHRHHPPVVGHKFSIAAVKDARIVGVVIVGRPTARRRDDGATLEVTRLCTDGTPNACSFLYGAAAKATFALGYQRIGTYILPAEGGASLRASGWRLIGETPGRSWSVKSRPRIDKHQLGIRELWERTAIVALCLLLPACASTSLTESEDRIVIHHGLGGHLQSTEAVYEDIEATGKPVVIDGHLHSADAFYALALPNACYTERASISLHAISWLGVVPSAKHTGRMASGLPGPVETWFRASHAFHDPIGWAALDAGELSEIWPDGRC